MTSASIEPTIEKLITTGNPGLQNVAAIASINYRLSAHKNIPQDKTSTPAAEYRDAKHPEHLFDVKTAIKTLQQEYGFGSRYILVGHSCGATLAFQTVMGLSALGDAADSAPQIDLPIAIAGLAGIYDMRASRDSHPLISSYREFLQSAFGDDDKVLDDLSPANWKSFRESWPNGTHVFLLHSRGDSLVEEGQVDAMEQSLRMTWRDQERAVFYSRLRKWEHNEMWENGDPVADVILEAVKQVY